MALRVLLVDASPVMRSMLIRTLRLSAIPMAAVHQAGSVEEALGILRATTIDLVLVDAGLHGQQTAIPLDSEDRTALAHLPCLSYGTTACEQGLPAACPSVLARPFTARAVRRAILSVTQPAARGWARGPAAHMG